MMNLLSQFLNKSKVVYIHTFRKYTSKTELKTFTQKKQLYGNLFPNKLLSKKQKTPAYMYVANDKIAQDIDKHLQPYFKESTCDTILELNPGIGVFTRRLLDKEDQFKQIFLMESMDYFMENLQELHSLYPDRIKVKQGDLVDAWKLVFQDKIDNGSRTQELLSGMPIKKWEDDPNMVLFGAVGSYKFFQHLIVSAVFRHSFLSLGRTEMYLAIPPPIYLHLTCSNAIGYLIYRSTSILFQILFEYRFITRLPRDEFLPTQAEYNLKKRNKLGRILAVNPEFLYLVRIVPRRDINKYVDLEDLPALCYFIKQNCFSRRNRVIPNLEKLVPRCGARLIINTDESEPCVPLYEDEDEENLPPYSIRCHTMHNRDFYPGMNIYTQFGDLTPSQLLTLFSTFRQWPEYKESSFLPSFENSMLKIEASDSIEGIAEEDVDLPAEQSTKEEETLTPLTEKSTSKSTTKQQRR